MAQPAVGPSGGIELPHEIRVVSQSVSQSLDLCGRERIRVKQPGRVWWMEGISGIVWRPDLCLVCGSGD